MNISFLVRDNTSVYEQRRNSSKIIANLTTNSSDDQTNFSPQKLQTQLSVQDTIQRHFCQILKNDSLTVTDNTTLTETILMRENSSSNPPALSTLKEKIRTDGVWFINIDYVNIISFSYNAIDSTDVQ